MNLTLNDLTENEFDETLDFLRCLYGESWPAGDLGSRYYRWKLMNRPQHMHSKAAGYVLKHEKKIVGFCGHLPFWLEGGGPPREAGWICDWNMRSDLRGQGVGTSMLREVIAKHQATASLVASPTAETVYQKAGMTYDDRPKLYLYVVNLAKFYSRKQPRPMRKVAAWSYWKLNQSRRTAEDGRFVNPDCWDIHEVVEPPADGNDPWFSIVLDNSNVRAARRSWDVLKWILRYPIGGTRLFIVEKDQQPIGHILLRAETDQLNMQRGRILDIILPLDRQDGWTWATDRAMHFLLHEHGVDYVEAIASHPVQISAFLEKGFHVRAKRGIWYHDPSSRLGPSGEWLTSFLDKDNAFRGAMIGPP